MILLAALAGSIDSPGGLTLGPPSALLGKWRMEQRGAMSDDIWQLRIGAAEWPGLSTGMATTQPDETLNTMETKQPYQLRFAWFNSSNFLAPTCSAQPKRWHKALLESIEFCVIQDLWMTPTAMAVGDWFLPMATWAEHDGIVLTHYGRNTVFMGPMNKALQVGECMSDIEICLMFGSKLTPNWWPWLDSNWMPGDKDGAAIDRTELDAAVDKFFSDSLVPMASSTTSSARVCSASTASLASTPSLVRSRPTRSSTPPGARIRCLTTRSRTISRSHVRRTPRLIR